MAKAANAKAEAKLAKAEAAAAKKEAAERFPAVIGDETMTGDGAAGSRHLRPDQTHIALTTSENNQVLIDMPM